MRKEMGLRQQPKANRVVITGVGVICPLGMSLMDSVSSIKEGRVSFHFSPVYPHVIISAVEDGFKETIPPFKYKRYLSRAGMLILSGARQAIIDSGLRKELLEDAGLFLGVGPNTASLGEENLSDALALLKVIPNMVTYTISAIFGVRGENLTISNACTSSLQAIGEAYQKIKKGELSIALCGGGDSRLNKWGLKLYQKARVLLESQDRSPHMVYAPFDRNNRGFVPGEGSAILVLEERERAMGRGARIYGEIKGYGSSLDGSNPTAPHPEGRWLKKAVERALGEAGITEKDVDVVFAHATGTPLNDRAEIEVISSIFPNFIRVCGIKSWTGHLSAGCGAVELSLAVACLREGFLPPIRNLRAPREHPDSVEFIIYMEEGIFTKFLIQNMGFGGHNAALVVEVCR